MFGSGGHSRVDGDEIVNGGFWTKVVAFLLFWMVLVLVVVSLVQRLGAIPLMDPCLS